MKRSKSTSARRPPGAASKPHEILSVSPAAKADLDEIEEYIARDSVEAVERWINRLIDAFRLLATNPGLGHVRRDLTLAPVLFWPVEAYVLIYRVGRDGIEVVAVTQGGRDIPRLLGQRSV